MYVITSYVRRQLSWCKHKKIPPKVWTKPYHYKSLQHGRVHEMVISTPKKQNVIVSWWCHLSSQIKNRFHDKVFLFNIKYNIKEVFLTDTDFLYSKNKNCCDDFVSLIEIWYTSLSNYWEHSRRGHFSPIHLHQVNFMTGSFICI